MSGGNPLELETSWMAGNLMDAPRQIPKDAQPGGTRGLEVTSKTIPYKAAKVNESVKQRK
jgi:hypothetical protein